jgi:hypothetical protein
MAKIEIELTDEQIEKLNELEKNHQVDLGQLIDNFYEARTMVSSEIENFEKNTSVASKVKENSLDVDNKAENLEENFTCTETYEVQIKDARHKISWAKDIFKL